jgi:hypothetical protein
MGETKVAAKEVPEMQQMALAPLATTMQEILLSLEETLVMLPTRAMLLTLEETPLGTRKHL